MDVDTNLLYMHYGQHKSTWWLLGAAALTRRFSASTSSMGCARLAHTLLVLGWIVNAAFLSH